MSVTCLSSLTPRAVLAADIQIANTARARAWHQLQKPLVEAEDRALELALRGSTRIGAWRKRAGHPPQPTKQQTAAWRALLNLRFALGAWRRNHLTPHRAA